MKNNIDDKTLEEMANFKPAITKETMESMEKGAASVGLSRRLTLASLAADADILSNLSIDEPEAFGELIDSVKNFLEHSGALHEVAETAHFRLMVADCRDGGLANQQSA